LAERIASLTVSREPLELLLATDPALDMALAARDRPELDAMAPTATVRRVVRRLGHADHGPGCVEVFDRRRVSAGGHDESVRAARDPAPLARGLGDVRARGAGERQALRRARAVAVLREPCRALRWFELGEP